MKTFKCINCGKDVKRKKEGKFCSKECESEYKKSHPKHIIRVDRIPVKCAYCGKEEMVRPYRAIRYVCCSTQCLGKYNSIRYSKKVKLICPICNKEYEVQSSKVNKHKTCGDKDCVSKWRKMISIGSKNPKYKWPEDLLAEQSVNQEKHSKSKIIYLHVVKINLGLNSTKEIPKGYVVHHKDANHENNDPHNLVVLPKSTHRRIHTIFGNALINALHTNRISKDDFIKVCNKEQWEFYKEIIDLDVTRQAVVKQGELLGRPEEENQHPSIYRNIYEGSSTNERVLTDNAEDSNFDTSALPNI